MTKTELQRIVRVWKTRLHLTHWRITLEWDENPDDAYANIQDEAQYDNATLRIASNFETWTPRFANEVVVHELVHLLTRDLEATGNAAGDLLSRQAKTLFVDRFAFEMEGVVDRVATRLVDLGGLA